MNILIASVLATIIVLFLNSNFGRKLERWFKYKNELIEDILEVSDQHLALLEENKELMGEIEELADELFKMSEKYDDWEFIDKKIEEGE